MFRDGRKFFAISKNMQRIKHMCGEDLYEGLFILQDDNSFEYHWIVSGPQKKYKIKTIYYRK